MWVFLIGMSVGVPSSAALAQDKMVVDIQNPSARRVSVAVPALLTGPGVDAAVAQKAADLLAKDLDFSGVFRTVGSKSWLTDPMRDTLDLPNYKGWSVSGADSLVRGMIQRKDGGYAIEFRYYDTVQGKPVLLPGGSIGKVYNVKENVAPAVHAFANVLMELLTSRTGPFGSRLAFEYREPKSSRKDLRVVDLDGSNMQPLTRNNLLNLSPAWSPDGKQLVYTSYKRRNPDLYLMNVVTGNETVISNRAGTNTGGSFSPDGQSIVASLSFEGDSNIYTLDLQGKILARLTKGGSIDVQPVFSPDGGRIAFTSDRVGNPNVFLMNKDGSQLHRLTINGKYNSSPAWNSTGEWIAYFSRDDGNIWLTKPDGSETKRLTNGEGTNEDPSWSPDGRYVVFSSNRAGTFDLWAADSVSGTVTRLTDLPGDERNPAWGRSFNQ
jgi:TolB protein